MASFDYNYQNPSLYLFLMFIRAIDIGTPLGLQNLQNKQKTKGNLVVVVKGRYCANPLLPEYRHPLKHKCEQHGCDLRIKRQNIYVVLLHPTGSFCSPPFTHVTQR